MPKCYKYELHLDYLYKMPFVLLTAILKEVCIAARHVQVIHQ